MKISVKKLRTLINEVWREPGEDDFGVYDTREKLDRSISSMDADSVAEKDYVDSDTGEVYLSKGEQARRSDLHPQARADAEQARSERHAAWAAEENQWAAEDEEAEMASVRAAEEAHEAARIALDNAVTQFADQSTDFVHDNPDVDPSGVVTDLADSFFFQNPQWLDWADALHMTKETIKSYVAEMAYEAMLKAKGED